MQLNSEMFTLFGEGRFEEFLENGAAELQQTFPHRFLVFADPDDAHDAARQVVGESYETAAELGRRSGLLAMRIAFLRTALGRGALEDMRLPAARECVLRQIDALTITEDRSVSDLLTGLRPYWEGSPFSRTADARQDLLRRLDPAVDDWSSVLQYLQNSHAGSGLATDAAALQAFVNQAFRDGVTLGLASNDALRLYVLMADALGLQFYADPLLPGWEALFRRGDQPQILAAMKASCYGGSE